MQISARQQLLYQPRPRLIGSSVVRATHARSRLAARAAPVTSGDGPSTSAGGGGAPPSPADAWALLRAFTLAEARGGPGAVQHHLGSADERARLRDALLVAYAEPWPEGGWAPQPDAEVLLGLVAGDARAAVRALRDWCGALGLDYKLPESKVPGAESLGAVQGSVYVKYNSRSQVCYLTGYQGRDRGVLIQLGGLQLGHFPLGFWDEGRANPPPPML
ncbi:MAG: hypothetical protein J3K34DRAFT_143479 [Monoraphidium minutum]|nr:MAG: hypothetical protein J3K34DRAFT_143479 [Monoraphidium minutum]